MKTLVIDVGGTHVKLLMTGKRTPVKIASGPEMTPQHMAEVVLEATKDWSYDRISIGFPGPVVHDTPFAEPHNLGGGWVGFPYRKTFGKPMKLVNDAAMQALGSYKGGRMLFLGLGTGLGSALVMDGLVEPMELAHLPYKGSKTYEDYAGDAGRKRLGKKRWRKHVADIIERFRAATEAEYVVIGGGNAKHLKELAKNVELGSNGNAFTGGFRLWEQVKTRGK